MKAVANNPQLEPRDAYFLFRDRLTDITIQWVSEFVLHARAALDYIIFIVSQSDAGDKFRPDYDRTQFPIQEAPQLFARNRKTFLRHLTPEHIRIFLEGGVHVKVSNPNEATEDRVAVTRNLLRRIASALEITDLIALMMVFVAGLSAYATWKTAQVTNEILLTSQRPYIGIEAINFVDETNPKVVADLRNFGNVQAEDAVISIVLKVDGKALSSESEPQQQEAPIVLSPAVPHPFYRHVAADTYRDVVRGKTSLVVETRVRYRGPRGDEHCYLMRDSYDYIDRVFYPRAGSLSCDHKTDTHPAR
jgi:hypothetical protein